MNNVDKKATPWVSYVVLLGCVLIAALLVYVAQQAFALRDDWNPDSRFSEYLSN